MPIQKPQCILLTGPLGAGKTTLAARYGAEHPLTLVVSTDELVVMVGGWLQHEDTALHMAFAFALDMTQRHLGAGHNVLLPYFVHAAAEIDAIAVVAKQAGADFYAVQLTIPKDISTQRTVMRGRWGEPGSPPITQADVPIIESKYDELLAATAHYPGIHQISTHKLNETEAYRQLLAATTNK
jgi:predicted kinase